MNNFEEASWITHKRFLEHKPIELLHKESEKCDNEEHDISLLNHHMFFRKKFSCKKAEEVKINISADDYYKLYINGKYITQGPAPSYHFHYNYNTIDISDYINEGENTIAIHVYYQGLVNRVWNSGDYRQGLIACVYCGDYTIAATDGTWKSFVCNAWQRSVITGYQTQYMEDIESRLIPQGWKHQNFDDTNWDYAVINELDDHLLFRQITPNLTVYDTVPSKIIQLSKTRVFVDIGKEVAGQIKFKALGKSGEKIEIKLGEELLAENSVRYEMRCNCEYRQYWTLSGVWDDVEFYDYLAFRYFEILLPSDTTEIEDIKIEVRHYPFDDANCTFSSSDKILNDIFELCKNTVKYCAQENFVDCPTREKGQYLGDCTIAAHSHMILSGDTKLYKKTLYDFAHSCNICKGMMAVAPGSYMQEIADYSCQYPHQLYTYYSYTGDMDTLRELYPYCLGVEKWFDQYAGDDLLINKVTGKWNLVDWPKNLRDGYEYDENIPIGDCKHSVMNAFYYGLKKYNTKIRAILKVEEEYDLEKLRQNFNDTFYDSQKRLFIDSVGSKHSSLHANALPLYYGITPEDGISESIKLIAGKGLRCGVYFAYFVLKSLASAGEYELLYDLIVSNDCNSWSTMLKEGATTCFESWSKEQKWNTSLCHAWASAPIIAITEDLAGINISQGDMDDIRYTNNIPDKLSEFNLKVTINHYIISIQKNNTIVKFTKSKI